MPEDTYASHAPTFTGASDASANVPIDRELLLHQLRDRDPVSRMRAARAFCDIAEPRAVDALIELLRDACPLARVSAAYALGRNASSRVVEPLAIALDRDWNGYVRKGAVWALGNAKDERALPAVTQAMRYDISAVRLWAASALGQIGGTEAVAPLAAGVRHDPIAAVRSNCAWALGQLLPTLSDRERANWPEETPYLDALSALIAAMNDDADEGVQDDARTALEKLGDPVGLAAIADWQDEQYYN